uniref:Uncharacterized protein n=1 Tax=Gossypium raimondii TaxID=29730 RepID=A0A0D2UWF1_GOSRA|nr:hypothetical protein B456_011G208500 [Gossypium raimondii]
MASLGLGILRRFLENAANAYFQRHLELLTKSLLDLVDEGIVKEADVDSFNLPLYTPCKEEELQVFVMEANCSSREELLGSKEIWVQKGKKFANASRAIFEPIICSHFGDAVIDKLYTRFATPAANAITYSMDHKTLNIVVSLTRSIFINK